MAVEKTTLQRAVRDMPLVETTDSKTAESAKSFNNANINPFVGQQSKQAITAPKTVLFSTGTQERKNSLGGFGNNLFGNGLITDEKEKSELITELPNENKNKGIVAFSNYFKSTFGQVKSKVDDYDSAINNALKYLPSKGELDIIVASNPRIRAILKEAGLPVKMNYDNLKTIKHSHIASTVEFTRAIGKELGYNDNQLQTMQVGAALHDIGKTLIPSEILNKNGKLTDSERKIINLHSVLGYEILKSAGFGTNVAEIARDHHNPNSQNEMAKIVRGADVYSAMREERPYKEAKSHDSAMNVLNNMGVSRSVLASLDKKYGTKEKAQFNSYPQTLSQAV